MGFAKLHLLELELFSISKIKNQGIIEKIFVGYSIPDPQKTTLELTTEARSI